ncbi:MAG: hypothetical protein ABFD24_00815 [Anaerolineaceae bacterium]|jgi:hypothetical protein
MERTVPRSASDEIDLYLRTIYSLLKSTTEVKVRSLEEVHAGINSSLHPYARKSTLDASAFIYSILRLPDCISHVSSIVLGQSASLFARYGYEDIESWEPVSARARRRRCYYDGKQTLACFIASRSDIEDVIPVLVAYQIEWNKLHDLLQDCPHDLLETIQPHDEDQLEQLAEVLKLPIEDLTRLVAVLDNDLSVVLQDIAANYCEMGVRLLSGSLSEYLRATRLWWENIHQNAPGLTESPVYFISSNTHSITNLVSGFALQHKEELVEFLKTDVNAFLLSEWEEIADHKVQSNQENFFYYLMKKYQQTPAGRHLIEEQAAYEKTRGITRIHSLHTFDVDAQIIRLSDLDRRSIDPRLLEDEQLKEHADRCDFLECSNALILNIDYPLGLGAYNILSKLAEELSEILGVYIMGKGATLNGVKGDMMIPSVVQDEQSLNTYLFQNVFTAHDVEPYLVYGTVLDNQKALTVLGTFLQNSRLMDVMYREGYTDIEMEAGPYLSAVYEMTRPKRYPVNEIVNLYGVPFEIGVLHYASDTPLSKGKNLGAGALSYEGMDSTYAASVAIMRRILNQEYKRLSAGGMYPKKQGN